MVQDRFGWLRHWISNREASARAEIDRFQRVRDESTREAQRATEEFSRMRKDQQVRRRRFGV